MSWIGKKGKICLFLVWVAYLSVMTYIHPHFLVVCISLGIMLGLMHGWFASWTIEQEETHEVLNDVDW